MISWKKLVVTKNMRKKNNHTLKILIEVKLCGFLIKSFEKMCKVFFNRCFKRFGGSLFQVWFKGYTSWFASLNMDNQISSITSSLKWWEEAKNEFPEESSLRLLPRPVNHKRKNQCLNKPRPSRAYKSKESAAFFSPRSLLENTSNKQTPTCCWGKIIPNKTSTQNCVLSLPPSHGFPLNRIHVLSHFSVQIPKKWPPKISSPGDDGINGANLTELLCQSLESKSDGNPRQCWAFVLIFLQRNFRGFRLYDFFSVQSRVDLKLQKISGGLVTWG